MKRNGWLVCLLLGAICGVGGVAWSRTAGTKGQFKPVGTGEANVCPTGSGEACSCSTGLNRGSLLKSVNKGPQQK